MNGASLPTEAIFLLFLAAWAGFLFFSFSRNAALKRRWFALYVAALGLVLGGVATFAAARSRTMESLIVVFPALALWGFLTVRQIRFCDACGASVHRLGALRDPPKSCPKCGAPLERTGGPPK
ncbi:zinc ribbon domain-containing protein [Methylocella silvestris]|uniref:Uncharacterized protein n=1 Tax=Methylocella silvestris TaxID=199596 RepID=A0A2J7TDY3_METSI|nr:zinc ribbon domain-containing protein [Methylocella silvestris]PNG24970.1 hypothetical protein CR492_15830 [Methylocella silvestris]